MLEQILPTHRRADHDEIRERLEIRLQAARDDAMVVHERPAAAVLVQRSGHRDRQEPGAEQRGTRDAGDEAGGVG